MRTNDIYYAVSHLKKIYNLNSGDSTTLNMIVNVILNLFLKNILK